MTREQQRKLKALKNSLMKTAQPYIKKYGWKKRDFMIWLKRDGLIFSLHLSVGENYGKCFLSGTGTVKPLWADDILWDILGMEENKKQPLSLRSIGAFTLHGAELYGRKYELVEWEQFELESAVEKMAAEFQVVVEKTGLDDFYRLAQQTIYHRELTECIISIYHGRYEEAQAVVAKMDSDYFSNEGLGFRVRAASYLEELVL